MHRRLLLLLVALTLAITACGSDEDRLTEEEFQTEANEICSVGSDEASDLSEELGAKLESGEEPTDTELEDLFGRLLDNVERQIDDIEELSPPEDLESDVEDALSEARDAIEEMRAQVDKDPQSLLNTDEDPFASVNEKLSDLGLDECSE
jgi:hypothetical protein